MISHAEWWVGGGAMLLCFLSAVVVRLLELWTLGYFHRRK
jgi:hypothetical protein